MNTRSQILCAWSGILCPVFLFLGIWIGGYFPPQSPTMTINEVVAFYQQNGNQVRFGMILIQIAGALYGSFAAGISAQMRRIEHPNTPVLSYTQLALGAATVLLFVIAAMFWVAASFRPERSPDVILGFHDMGWLIYIGVVATGILEYFAIGFLIISDRRASPIFPRWLGFLNIWIALLLVPAFVMPFFKTGPFAWDGLLSYWIPAVAFGGWFIIMGVQLIKTIRCQEAESS